MKTTDNDLVQMLQRAYSGELAAYYAYEGHWRSVSDPPEKEAIQRIQKEEWEHRECVGRFLHTLNAGPDRRAEILFTIIGKTIGFLCRIGGWFVPMYGAGKLERGNIVEYEIAALEAMRCGYEQMADSLLTMAEVEWDHEKFFREKSAGHWLAKIVTIWSPPPPREEIREAFRHRDLAKPEGTEKLAHR